MSTTKWRKGAPPSIGWWPASASKSLNKDAIRWWNGTEWSCVAWPECSDTEAAYAARTAYQFQADIKWSERWWL